MENPSIRMVDLNGQYKKIKPEIDKAIQNVIDSTAFINGPDVKAFKTELANYLQVKNVVTCANGTDALQIALMALGLKPGNEVIVPTFTFIASAEVIAVMGLKPVLVDVDADTFNIDIEKTRKAITKNTKAVIVVHLYGQSVNMNEIMQMAEEKNLYVIEDNAQAIGSEYKYKGEWKKTGTIGHIGTTSFFPSKNLGAYGDGGAIMTNNNKLAEKMACIANHGAKVKYYHNEVGINSRLDTMQAAILRVKLPFLDTYIKARQKAADYYDTHLNNIDGITVPVRNELSTHVFHQYTLKVADKRDELIKHLQEKGIPGMVYYPVPMHKHQPYLCQGKFEVSEMLCNQVLSLPMHTELTEEQQNYICTTIKNFFS